MINRAASIIGINNISNTISNLRQGDYLFLDIDDTLVLLGIKKYKDEAICTEKNIISQLKCLKESGLHIIGLTARKNKHVTQTECQLNRLDIELEHIIYAPSLIDETTKEPILQKGIRLEEYINSLPPSCKPKRILVIDDNAKQLANIASRIENCQIPYILYHYQRKIHGSIHHYANDAADFPETLNDFTEVQSLGGGTQSTYKIINIITNQNLVIKYGVDSDAIKLEILCNAIYGVLEVPVPRIHLYKSIPPTLAKKINLKTPHGIFQESEFISAELNDVEKTKLSACQHFIAHALLGNIDIAKEDNFIGPVLIDAGANFMRRSKGEARNEDAYLFTELSSLRDENKNLTAHQWFSSLTFQTLQEQAKHVLQKSPEIERVIWELSSELELSANLHNNFLQYMAERLDILSTKYCIEERPAARIDKKANSKYTSAGVLTYTMMPEPHILIAKRVRHNWWGNFGGKSDAKDCDLTATAIREVAEESSNQLIYQKQELEKNPSHDLITYDEKNSFFTYRMYLMESLQVNLTKFKNKEHTDYCYIPLKFLIEALNKKTIKQEGKDTIEVVLPSGQAIVIYPPLYQMLQQSPC